MYGYAYSDPRTALIVIGVLSLLAAIAAAIFLLPKSRQSAMGSGMKKFCAFLNFDTGIAPMLIKVIFIAASLFMFIYGFYFMVSYQFVGGLIIMLMPVFLRVITEICLALLQIREHIASIDKKLNNAPTGFVPNKPADDNKTIPVYAQKICPTCGSVLKGDATFCGQCGTRL